MASDDLRDCRIKNGDTWESPEIGPVEGQKLGQPVGVHGRDQPGVVGQLPPALIRCDQGFPFAEQRRLIGKNWE